MKLFFDPNTYKLIDITSETPTELNYHYSEVLLDQEYLTTYDKNEENFYKLSPCQLEVGIVPKDIFFPETLNAIFKLVPLKDDFILGFKIGQTDGYLFGQRIYMSNRREITWSFLAGYEYGVLVGAYLNKEKMTD